MRMSERICHTLDDEARSFRNQSTNELDGLPRRLCSLGVGTCGSRIVRNCPKPRIQNDLKVPDAAIKVPYDAKHHNEALPLNLGSRQVLTGIHPSLLFQVMPQFGTQSVMIFKTYITRYLSILHWMDLEDEQSLPVGLALQSPHPLGVGFKETLRLEDTSDRCGHPKL
jgi:hypothetical protein